MEHCVKLGVRGRRVANKTWYTELRYNFNAFVLVLVCTDAKQQKKPKLRYIAEGEFVMLIKEAVEKRIIELCIENKKVV